MVGYPIYKFRFRTKHSQIFIIVDIIFDVEFPESRDIEEEGDDVDKHSQSNTGRQGGPSVSRVRSTYTVNVIIKGN